MRKPLREYLPPVLRSTYEFPLLCQVEQAEMDALGAAADGVLEDQFVVTAKERGLARYEAIFGIAPRDTDTLEDRRFRILTKITAQLPYTMRRLRQLLTLLCGEDGFSVALGSDAYLLIVRVELSARRNLEEAETLVRRMVPANLWVDYSLRYPHAAQVTVAGVLGRGYMETPLPVVLPDYHMTGVPLLVGGVFGTTTATVVPQLQ